MPPTPDDVNWDLSAATERCREFLLQYADPLLRSVASQLVKPKIGQTREDLAEKAADTLGNPPVIDRRLRDLPDSAKTLIRLIGLSRQPRWNVGQLLTLAAATGHGEGVTPVLTLLEAGLLFPQLAENQTLVDFTDWLGREGTLSAMTLIHPAVATRARSLREPKPSGKAKPNATPGQESDGLEWLLRMAAVWQQSRPAPIRVTQTLALYKRDLARFQSDAVLTAPFADVADTLADPGVLAFEWANAFGLFAAFETQRTTTKTLRFERGGMWPLLTQLFAAFFNIEQWDPLLGYQHRDDGVSPTPSAALIILDRLADADPHEATAADLCEPLWSDHPSLAGQFKKAQSEEWVTAFLVTVAYPLRIVELLADEPRRFRLSAFGRHLLLGHAEPPAPPTFPQTLLVQPNAEVLAYRQGLTPTLIAELTRFATWKSIGPACTLELTADETYRGLESGLTLAAIQQTLDRHTARPVPAAVVDLLKRWANKRERITVFPSATLVEFATAAELESALTRGIVAIRLTDRVGLTADGSDPVFQQLRLVGNRDYDGKPVKCVAVAPDGVTLSVDAAQSDLLLEAEVVRIADPLPEAPNGVRKYLLTPTSLRRASDGVDTLESLDRWFVARTGEPLSPAGRLLVVGRGVPPLTSSTLTIVRVANAELADGLAQWPQTSQWIVERLGPTAFVVAAANLPQFELSVQQLGITMMNS
jgi:hypothetical protein